MKVNINQQELLINNILSVLPFISHASLEVNKDYYEILITDKFNNQNLKQHINNQSYHNTFETILEYLKIHSETIGKEIYKGHYLNNIYLFLQSTVTNFKSKANEIILKVFNDFKLNKDKRIFYGQLLDYSNGNFSVDDRLSSKQSCLTLIKKANENYKEINTVIDINKVNAFIQNTIHWYLSIQVDKKEELENILLQLFELEKLKIHIENILKTYLNNNQQQHLEKLLPIVVKSDAHRKDYAKALIQNSTNTQC